MSYPNYTTKDLFLIGQMASTRIRNYNEFKDMFGFFFWGFKENYIRGVFDLLFLTNFSKDVIKIIK